VGPRFFGRHDRSLDVKGRIILPARFRAHFDTLAYLAQHEEGCLALWTPDEFELRLAQMQNTQEQGSEGRNMARIWSAGLSEVELDRQGRVAIPPYLRSYARLEGVALVIGALNRIEIWNPAVWEQKVLPAEARLMDPESSPAARLRGPGGEE
jgi:MraZ protein